VITEAGSARREAYQVSREDREWIRSGEWDFVSPNPVLQPRFSIRMGTQGTPVGLIAEGNSRPECVGYARCRVRLKGGAWYRLAVTFQFQNLDPVEVHTVHGLYGDGFSGGIASLDVDGDRAHGEERFAGPEADMDAELRLYFRLSAHGRICWESVALQECDPEKPRLVSIACHHGPLATGATTEYWEQWLNSAGNRGASLALLPEIFDGKGPEAAETADGPAASLLSAKARQWKMLTCGTRYERRGDLVYNTARLFGRKGELLGFYDKSVLFEPELDKGVSPGRGPDVFRTVLGNIGIMTCYDGWFPEIAQALAVKGAEIVLFPNVGYYVPLAPGRAVDNGVFLVTSSINGPAGIWDPGGVRAGQTEIEPTQESPTSVVESQFSETDRMLVATVDLSRKYAPHWRGGPRAARWNAIQPRQTIGIRR
jgi:predicted amidohydrolase